MCGPLSACLLRKRTTGTDDGICLSERAACSVAFELDKHHLGRDLAVGVLDDGDIERDGSDHTAARPDEELVGGELVHERERLLVIGGLQRLSPGAIEPVGVPAGEPRSCEMYRGEKNEVLKARLFRRRGPAI